MSLKEMKIFAVGTEDYEIMDEKARPVKSIEEMKAIENLKSGDIIKTIGYYSANDGGGATYLIREKLETDIEDNGAVHFINDTLVAELIIKNKTITPKMFGAKGDGITDDSTIFNITLNYARENNLKVECSQTDIFLINTSLNCNNVFVNFNKCLLKTNVDIPLIEINTQEYYTTLENINIDCLNTSCGLKITEGRKVTIRDIKIINISGVGIQYLKGYEIKIEHIDLIGDGISKCIGMDMQSGDSTFNDIIMIDCYIAIHNKYGFNIYNDVHCWILTKALCYKSTMFVLNGSMVMLSNIYSDTYHYFIKQEHYYTHINASNVTFIVNNGIMLPENMNNEDSLIIYNSSIEGDRGKLVNITSGYIKKPTNFNIRETNLSSFYGVMDLLYDGSFDDETFENNIVPTVPDSLSIDRCNVDSKINSMDIDIKLKINEVATAYNGITMQMKAKTTQIPVYEMDTYSNIVLCGVAYIQNNSLGIEINSGHTLTVGKYLLIRGHIKTKPQI